MLTFSGVRCLPLLVVFCFSIFILTQTGRDSIYSCGRFLGLMLFLLVHARARERERERERERLVLARERERDKERDRERKFLFISCLFDLSCWGEDYLFVLNIILRASNKKQQQKFSFF